VITAFPSTTTFIMINQQQETGGWVGTRFKSLQQFGFLGFVVIIVAVLVFC